MQRIVDLCFLFLVFGSVGLGLEVIFTSLFPKPGEDRAHLFGYSSLWYLPLYGFFLPLGYWLLYKSIADLPLLARGIIYVPLFFAGEYMGMRYLHHRNGESPSEANYKKAQWNVHGFIRLDYAPLFFAASLIFEKLYRSLVLN